mmetsp:Transcript_19275/g.57108  ORF Transcript_19275/g.57108 Transcript_19275/m.57108 type:complete len:247 (+) Transcript_19275:181-921(+)
MQLTPAPEACSISSLRSRSSCRHGSACARLLSSATAPPSSAGTRSTAQSSARASCRLSFCLKTSGCSRCSPSSYRPSTSAPRCGQRMPRSTQATRTRPRLASASTWETASPRWCRRSSSQSASLRRSSTRATSACSAWSCFGRSFTAPASTSSSTSSTAASAARLARIPWALLCRPMVSGWHCPRSACGRPRGLSSTAATRPLATPRHRASEPEFSCYTRSFITNARHSSFSHEAAIALPNKFTPV